MDIQILRTRYPPDPYIVQLSELLTHAGFDATNEDVRRRLGNFHKGDRLLLAVKGEELIGYAQLRISQDLVSDETAEVAAILYRGLSTPSGRLIPAPPMSSASRL